MSRRLVRRLAKLFVRVGVAISLLIDTPQQLELRIQTSEGLASLSARAVQPAPRDPENGTNVAEPAAVTGIAWLARVFLPYAEPNPDP